MNIHEIQNVIFCKEVSVLHILICLVLPFQISYINHVRMTICQNVTEATG